MSILYVVGTPIGNMKDITYRAVEVLKEVDIVACEDTRQSRKLLDHYGIEKRTLSCRARNEENSAKGIVKLMDEGADVAYLTDAGTPGISDPGSVLVSHVRNAGHDIYPLPGPSAFASLISIAGIGGKTYLFEGFLPQKPGKRRKRLVELMEREESFVLYESPFRIIKLLTELSEIDNDRVVVVGREMTKAFEEYKSATPKELIFLLEKENSVKGEFSVLVSGKKKT
ncbi:16S rRNA (cytidine(1402)-2'-O)-methyltransferase [Spirochaeta cellobiosiphila]|uniref:16S rRNA (cytidine(1402)-2'-O)-methyltransferase n=1 Tax=Spirochaeta cellobiosiphila TaxID=504483 RepID=UPI00048E9166|nr:16S rRNA (cytidine(1402)-2'-O)-methyltransferase [Spirochaeta cellobiosiphila]